MKAEMRRFGITEDVEEEDLAVAKELFEAEMSKYRAQLKSEIEGFEIPKYEPKVLSAQEPQIDEEAIKKFNTFVESHPATKAIVSDGNLKIKVGDMPVSLKVDADYLTRSVTDFNEIFANIRDDKGNIDLERYYLMATIAKDPDSVFKAIADLARSEEREKIVNEAAGTPQGEAGSGADGGDDGDKPFNKAVAEALSKLKR